jgi:hypothetical protein
MPRKETPLTPKELADKFTERRFRVLQVARERNERIRKGLPLLPDQRRKWTQEEDQQLAKLYNRKLSQQAIGDLMGRAQSSVGKRLTVIGWTKCVVAVKPTMPLKAPPLNKKHPEDKGHGLRPVNFASGQMEAIASPITPRERARKWREDGKLEKQALGKQGVLASVTCECLPYMTKIIRLPSTVDIGKAACPSCRRMGTLKRH